MSIIFYILNTVWRLLPQRKNCIPLMRGLPLKFGKRSLSKKEITVCLKKIV